MDVAFSCIDKPGYRLVTVTGDIDGTNGSEFKLACSCATPVIVDLLRCSYMDSVGLHVLIERSRTPELRLVLTPPSRIYRIFAITNLVKYFTIVASANQAIARLTGRLASDLPRTMSAATSAVQLPPDRPYAGAP